MGNCLDCLRHSSRGGPGRIEEGSAAKEKLGNELESVLLESRSCEVEVLRAANNDENNKQLDKNHVAQSEVDINISQPMLDASPKDLSKGQSYHPSPNSTVARRLFSSPQKSSDKSPSLSNNHHGDSSNSLTSAKLAPSIATDSCHANNIRGGAAEGAAKVGGAKVDINKCNEQQLLVVGFSRDEARAVINHRILHGRFDQTPDIRTVPGLSEETWLKVKSRLTLVPSSALHFKSSSHSRRSNTSSENTRGHIGMKLQDDDNDVIILDNNKDVIVIDDDDDEKDDVQIVEEKRKRPSVDLNHANVHQLCCIGITQSLAKEIVNYRVARRGFKSVDEIKDVPGMTESKFSEICQRLTLTPANPSIYRTPKRKSQNSSLMPSPISKGCYLSGNNMQFVIDDDTPPKRSTSSSGSASHNHSSRSSVPSSECITPRQQTAAPASALPRSPASSAKRGNKSIRIATWNLQCFSEKKVRNVGVLEVVCTTIVKHGFDIIAVQEIGSKGEPLQLVCHELNDPTTSAVKALGSSRKKWRCCISPQYTGRMFEGFEYNGFLWNEQSGIHYIESFLLENFKDFFVRKPFAGKFTVKDWSFTLVSLHLRAEGGWGKDHTKELQNEVGNLPLLVTSIEALKADDVILLGDFNMEPSAPCFGSLRSYGYVNVFNSDEPTNISAANPDGSRCYDNIWISEELMNRRCRGNVRNVVRRNLQHSMISDSKSPGKPGTVSDHCPVWAGFTTSF